MPFTSRPFIFGFTISPLDYSVCMLSRFSCVSLFVTRWTLARLRLLCPQDSPGKSTGVGCHALLQGIFLTQVSNLHLRLLLHCTHILFFFFLHFLKKFILFLTLQYCIGFAIYRNESATGIHASPILNPPPSSLPIPSLWVLPVYQLQASNLDWRLVSYMILYIFQCHSPKSSHPLPLPQSP